MTPYARESTKDNEKQHFLSLYIIALVNEVYIVPSHSFCYILYVTSVSIVCSHTYSFTMVLALCAALNGSVRLGIFMHVYDCVQLYL